MCLCQLLLEDSPEGFQPSAFRRREIVRQPEVSKVTKESLESRDSALEVDGSRAEDRRPLRLELPPGILEQGFPVGFVRHAIGGHQGVSVRRFHLVLLDGIENVILITALEGGELDPDRWADTTSRERDLTLGREPLRKLQPFRHPGSLVPQERGDGAVSQLVILDERLDDAGLIQGGDGPRRRVGHQEEPLAGRKPSCRRRLDDCRDRPVSRLAPRLESLEAIDDLVVPLVGRHHAHRQVRQRRRRAPEITGAQRGQGLSDLLEGEFDPGAGQVPGASERSG